MRKNPGDLTDDQAVTLRKLTRRGGDLWRAYARKEARRAVFAGDLTEAGVGELLDRFCSKASRSGLKPFVTAAKTIRKRRAGILAAVRLGINNAGHEGLNRCVRLIINRAYGFHSANAAPAQRPPTRTPTARRSLNRPTFMPGGPEKASPSCGATIGGFPFESLFAHRVIRSTG
ncbi:MAG: transposase [Actinobacteria bacterium]|nr:transposase [Actinomycetota bacterium]